MIKFLQHKSDKYPPRTWENASADVTIAFAFELDTPGERLTYSAVRSQGKLYIPVNPARPLSKGKIFSDVNLIHEAKTINIAGNGLYTTIKNGFDQHKCDEFVLRYLTEIFSHTNKSNIMLIRSGGQTGFDESGLKAAIRLRVPALCVCPKGWKFTDMHGETICDEKQFKNRFSSALIF